MKEQIEMKPGIISSEIKPQIIIDNLNIQGFHNIDLDKSRNRLSQARSYKDLSTICIIPVIGKPEARGMIHFKVVQSWMNLFTAMNQKFIRMFLYGMEVGVAYSTAIEMILNNPELSKWKYILTLEEDNAPPPDGLIKLYESVGDGSGDRYEKDKYDIVGGLYWTKGEGGQPMIYGNPKDIENGLPLNFIPQIPLIDQVQECNGLGMGFTLFKLDIFKDERLKKLGPYFKTVQEYIPYQGSRGFTQDLYFFNNIHSLGYKVACDTRVKVGHHDQITDIIW